MNSTVVTVLSESVVFGALLVHSGDNCSSNNTTTIIVTVYQKLTDLRAYNFTLCFAVNTIIISQRLKLL